MYLLTTDMPPDTRVDLVPEAREFLVHWLNNYQPVDKRGFRGLCAAAGRYHTEFLGSKCFPRLNGIADEGDLEDYFLYTVFHDPWPFANEDERLAFVHANLPE